MDCQYARDSAVIAAARGTALGPAVEIHIANCEACQRDIEPLLAVGRALDGLESFEPSLRTTRSLRRRFVRERVREKLGSLENWSVAALTACIAFIISTLMEATLPYGTLASACEALVSHFLPTPTAYVFVGMFYSIVPICLGTYVQARQRVNDVVGWIETPTIFAALLGGYAILTCSDFPMAFLTGLLTGIVVGAFAGATAGTLLGRRAAWR